MGFVEEMNAVYEQAGGSLCHTDSELLVAVQTNDTAEQQRLQKVVHAEFWKTTEGKKLKACKNPSVVNRLLDVFTKRYGANATLYIFRLQDCARDLLQAEFSEPVVNLAFDPPEPSESEKHTALVAQVRRDMQDPKVSSITINERRKSSVAYERAFQDANTPDAVAAKPKAPSEIVQFAHMANETIRDCGISALKPHAGIVTIQAGGKRYEYDLADFKRLFEQATQHGLIR